MRRRNDDEMARPLPRPFGRPPMTTHFGTGHGAICGLIIRQQLIHRSFIKASSHTPSSNRPPEMDRPAKFELLNNNHVDQYPFLHVAARCIDWRPNHFPLLFSLHCGAGLDPFLPAAPGHEKGNGRGPQNPKRTAISGQSSSSWAECNQSSVIHHSNKHATARQGSPEKGGQVDRRVGGGKSNHLIIIRQRSDDDGHREQRPATVQTNKRRRLTARR